MQTTYRTVELTTHDMRSICGLIRGKVREKQRKIEHLKQKFKEDADQEVIGGLEQDIADLTLLYNVVETQLEDR